MKLTDQQEMNWRYVVGFMFDERFENVALMRKQKPEWQKGLLNGIGGKIEADERPLSAMIRESIEETGVEVDWYPFSILSGINNDGSVFELFCFWTIVPILPFSMEPEQIEHVAVSENRQDIIKNLKWLIPLAIDFATNSQGPSSSQVVYGGPATWRES